MISISDSIAKLKKELVLVKDELVMVKDCLEVAKEKIREYKVPKKRSFFELLQDIFI